MILATLCYLKKDGKTLMLHRVKKENDIHRGKWNGLGGKLMPGETPEECVIREVKEESGLILRNPVWKGFLTFPDFDGREDWYVFVFVARDFEGEVTESSEGRLAWIDDREIRALPLWEGDHLFLEWMKDGRFFSGKLIYEAGKFRGGRVAFHGPGDSAASA
jgi:8-oxo-dGTP diphosphatase